MGSRSAINWYLETNGETTSFYEGEFRDFTEKIYPNSPSGYKLCDPSLITMSESFVAKENESWLIDLDCPHSVSFYPNEKEYFKKYRNDSVSFRLMLQCAFTISYKELIHIMRKVGYL